MPKRPAWAASIVPPKVDIKMMDQQLSQCEHDYFHGGLNEHGRTVTLSSAAHGASH
jgi:hypothetical protein